MKPLEAHESHRAGDLKNRLSIIWTNFERYLPHNSGALRDQYLHKDAGKAYGA